MSTNPNKRDLNLINRAIQEMSIIDEKEKTITNFNVKLVRLEAFMLSSFYDKNKDKMQETGFPDLSEVMPAKHAERVKDTLSNFLIPVPKGFKPPSADTSLFDTENVRDRVQATVPWLVSIKNDPDRAKYPERDLSKATVVRMEDLSENLSKGLKDNISRINAYSKGDIKNNMVNLKAMQETLDKGEDIGFKSTQYLVKRFAFDKSNGQLVSRYSVMNQGNNKDYTSVSAINDEPSFIIMKGGNTENGNPTGASQIVIMTEDLHNKKMQGGEITDKTKHPLDPIEASIYLSTLDKNHYMSDPDVSVLLVDSRHLKSVVNDIKEYNPDVAIRFAFKSDNTPVAKPTKENKYRFEESGGVLEEGLQRIVESSHDEKLYDATGFAVIPVKSDTSLKDLSKNFYDLAKERFPDNTEKQEEIYDKLMEMTGDKTKKLGDECKEGLIKAYQGINAPFVNDLSFSSRSSNLLKHPEGKPEPEPEPQQQLSL